MKKRFLVVALCFPLMASKELHEAVRTAIAQSEVVRTKSLVRQLSSLESSPQEKRRLLEDCIKQASEVIEEQSPLYMYHNWRDALNVIVGLNFVYASLFEIRAILRITQDKVDRDYEKKPTPGAKFAKEHRLLVKSQFMLEEIPFIGFFLYQLKKGWDCYHQRKTYDRAVRIHTWLEEQRDGL